MTVYTLYEGKRQDGTFGPTPIGDSTLYAYQVTCDAGVTLTLALQESVDGEGWVNVVGTPLTGTNTYITSSLNTAAGYVRCVTSASAGVGNFTVTLLIK